MIGKPGETESGSLRCPPLRGSDEAPRPYDHIFDSLDFRRQRLQEAIFKGFDGESVIGSAQVYLKPYWKDKGVSYFEEGVCGRW